MATEKPLPAEFHSKRFRAEEILVPEAGVFRNGYGLRLQRRPAPQAETVSPNLHISSEGGFEMRRQSSPYASILNHERDTGVRKPNADK
jgi:hypothetical protein